MADMKRKIFVDFEWHNIPNKCKEEKILANNEIIEFGAVMLDESNAEISSFKSYVKPRFVDKIYKNIQKLTGITMDMLEDAPDFCEVLADFITWCESESGDYDIYSWSESDLLQIRDEMNLKQVDRTDSIMYMLEHWIDAQHEFDRTLGFERQLSLQMALYIAGIDAVGKAHDALDDARNTSVLYTFLMNPVKQKTIISSIRSALCHEYKAPTLGDLIDWSQFNLEIA